jgi:recombinational DNA repair protein (RecF pathway)
MAKGVRKAGGRRGGSLSTFSEGTLTVHFRENRDLQTFREFSHTKVRMELAADPMRLAGASVLGELILLHAEAEGNQILFSSLGLGLDAMGASGKEDVVPTLLLHLWSLIRILGYAPMVRECAGCGRELAEDEMGRFDFGAGGLRCPSCEGETQGPRLGPGARAQLQSMLEGLPLRELTRPGAHLRLASDFVTYHISGGKPLRSMAVLGAFISETDA